MIVRPERTVHDMTSKVTLGQTKYQQVDIAFLGLFILNRQRQM